MRSTVGIPVSSGPGGCQKGLVGALHTAHVASIGKVDGLVLLVVVKDISGAKHIGVGKVNIGVPVRVGVVDMRQDRFSAANFHGFAPAVIRFCRQVFLRQGLFAIVLVIAGQQRQDRLVAVGVGIVTGGQALQSLRSIVQIFLCIEVWTDKRHFAFVQGARFQ